MRRTRVRQRNNHLNLEVVVGVKTLGRHPEAHRTTNITGKDHGIEAGAEVGHERPQRKTRRGIIHVQAHHRRSVRNTRKGKLFHYLLFHQLLIFKSFLLTVIKSTTNALAALTDTSTAVTKETVPETGTIAIMTVNTDTTKIIQKVAAIKSTRNTDLAKRSVTITAKTNIEAITIRVNIENAHVIEGDKCKCK